MIPWCVNWPGNRGSHNATDCTTADEFSGCKCLFTLPTTIVGLVGKKGRAFRIGRRCHCRSAEFASLNVTSPPTSHRIYTISTAHQLPRTLPLAILEPSEIMRLLQSDGDDNLSLTEFFEDDIPEYAILSHRW